MLLGDADVEHAIGELVGEGIEADRIEHRGGDADDIGTFIGDANDLIAEHRRPAGRGDALGLARMAVEGVGLVHLVVLVVDRDVVALSLLSQDMDQDGSAELLGLGQRVLDRIEVVAVDGAEVLDPEILEHALRSDGVLDALLDRVKSFIRGRADVLGAVEPLLDGAQRGLVAGIRTNVGEVVGEAADGRRVGTPVVVDHDDQPTVLVGGNVVEGLPRHAAGQGTVTDHGDNVVLLAEDRIGLGHAIGVGEARGGVRVFDPVVLGLGLARVAGEPALLAQRREFACAAGEHLVDVGLVPGVPDDPVLRRLENPVDRHRELDDTEVGAEMTAIGGDGVDEAFTDFGGEGGQLFGAQLPQVSGAMDLIENTHAVSFPSFQRSDSVYRWLGA